MKVDADDVHAIPHAWAGPFLPSWSLTSSLRVGHRLAALVDSTRESMLALCYNFWCQGAQS